MRKKIYSILKGEYLVSEGAAKNWLFILFCVGLAIFMIASSHKTERKVHEMAQLQKVERQLRSRFVDQRQELMRIKMESNVNRRLEGTGLGISDEPPYKIIVGRK